MSSNEKYQNFIIPKLQEFWNNYREDYLKSGLTDGLFLPYAFDGYDSCEKKIFYIGQDAPFWAKAHCMSTLFDDNNYRQYLRLNQDVMRPIEKRLGWGNRTSFWTMIIKTHLYITTNVWHNDIYKISDLDKKQLETIGWGNVHFIPLRQTINHYGQHSIQPKAYTAVDNALKDINDLQILVDVFSPNTIVILSTTFDSHRYFEGLNIVWLDLPSSVPTHLIKVGNIVYRKKTIRLIWVNNPTRYSYIGTNMQNISNLIKLYA